MRTINIHDNVDSLIWGHIGSIDSDIWYVRIMIGSSADSSGFLLRFVDVCPKMSLMIRS